MRAVILAGGAFELTPLTRPYLEAELIIAADGGLDHAIALNLKPHFIVGDFDSVDAATLAAFADVPREQFPVAKDLLDLEIAIHAALEHGALELRLFGVLGGRLDQTLAALFIAARLKKMGIQLSLHGAKQDVFLLVNKERLELPLVPPALFSVLSLVETSVISLENVLYPLEGFALAYGLGLGVSNRVKVSPLTVDLHSGLLAVIAERGGDESQG